ncbi:MAG: hypothetical protein IPP06_09670 [Saprospiraceae bacterium]|nr:hypothetical protein [Candidatus Vicinibacter affinis]
MSKKNYYLEYFIPLFVPLVTLLILFVLVKSSNNLKLVNVTLSDCFQSFLKILIDSEVWKAIYLTLYFAFKGIAIGLLAAFTFGLAVGFFPSSTKLVVYFLNGWRAIPLTLLIVFLKFLPTNIFLYPPGIEYDKLNLDPSWIIAIGSFQYLLLGIIEGIDHRSLVRERVFISIKGFSKFWYLRKILFFEVLPYFIYALRISILFSVVIAVVLDSLLFTGGIGHLVFQNKYNDDSYSILNNIGMLTIVAYLGVFIDLVYKRFSSHLLRWMS